MVHPASKAHKPVEEDAATHVATTSPDLLQNLLNKSQQTPSLEPVSADLDMRNEMASWEQAKSQLSEIQSLLVEAYHDLELMEIER